MNSLVIELSLETLKRLEVEAARQSRSPEEVAARLLEEQLVKVPSEPESEREQVRHILKEAGLLSELGDNLRTRIDRTVRHEDVVAALGRAGGKPLSKIILEQRGSKQ